MQESIQLETQHSLAHGSSGLPFHRFKALLLTLLALAVLCFLVQAFRYLPVTGDNMYPESAGVLSASFWANGAPLYQDYRHFPYLSTAFTPIWYLIIGVVAKAGISKLDSLVLVGRLLSLLSVLAIAFIAYRWNRILQLPRSTALLGSLLYLSFPILIPWAVTARPDFPPLLLTFLAVYFIGTRQSNINVLFSSFCAAAGFLMRHNAVGAPVAIVLWLIWLRRPKQAFLFCSGWALLVGAILGYYEHASRGLLLVNISGAKFGTLAVTYIRDIVLNILTPSGEGFAILVLALGAFAVAEAVKQSDQRIKLMLMYFCASLLFGLLGSAAAGAGANHFLEATLGASVLFPPAFARLEKSWQPTSTVNVLLTALVLAICLPTLDVQRWNAMHKRGEDLRELVPLVSSRKVFSDLPYLAARSSPPELIDMSSLINTERTGGEAGWSSIKLVHDLEQQEYDLVVLMAPIERAILPNPASRYPRTPRINAGIQSAIVQNYHFCFELSEAFVYAPNKSRAETEGCPSKP